jgi:CheY-like chemotaxis protein
MCRLAPHGASALELALGLQPAVIVAQLDLPLLDALKLGEILRANPRTQDARFIFLGYAESLSARGAVGDRLLPLKTPADSIILAIEDLLERQGRIDSLDFTGRGGGAAEGELQDLPLPDMLQSMLLHRRSGRLLLTREGLGAGPESGDLLVRDGEVVQALTGQVEGEKALFRLLAWRTGHFAFEPGYQDGPPGLLAPTRRLLVEGLRQVEEWDRLATQLPALDSPVRLTVRNAELPNIVHPLTQEVLLLLELYQTVREVVDHCAYPDYQVLRTLHTLSEREIVQLGRVPLADAASTRSSERLFTEIQASRLRDWLRDHGARPDAPADARLLVVASDAASVSDFERLLANIPSVELANTAEQRGDLENQLVRIGRVAVDEEMGIELVHLPRSASFEAFWPLASHGALGTLFLLSGALGDAAERVECVAASLGRMPRARTFHVALLGKDERLAPDELRENLTFIDEASLFLLPTQSEKAPSSLLRGLFARVMP